MATTTYVIRPRPAIRAFGVAAVLAAAGAGIAVGASSLGWHVAVSVLGVLLVLGAIALLLAALRVPAKQAVTVQLDAEGYRVVEASGTHQGVWRDVTRVTEAPGRLTFHRGDDERFHIFAPHSPGQLDSMASDIAGRLDHDRGYHPLP